MTVKLIEDFGEGGGGIDHITRKIGNMRTKFKLSLNNVF